MSHFTKICEFGKQHGTCRCPSKDKEIIKVECNTPKIHNPPVHQPLPVNPPWEDIIGDFLAEPKVVDIRFTPEEAKALRKVLQGDILAMSWGERTMLVHSIGVQLNRIGEEDDDV